MLIRGPQSNRTGGPAVAAIWLGFLWNFVLRPSNQPFENLEGTSVFGTTHLLVLEGSPEICYFREPPSFLGKQP